MGSEKTKASDAWRVESRKSYRTHREVPSRKNTDCGQSSLDGSNHIRVPGVFDDAPSHPATLYRHAADAGVASW